MNALPMLASIEQQRLAEVLVELNTSVYVLLVDAAPPGWSIWDTSRSIPLLARHNPTLYIRGRTRED